MKTAIKKGNRIKKAVVCFLSLFLFVISLFVNVKQETFQAYADSVETKYDSTYVMDDLKGMTIDGQAFQIADYSFSFGKDTNVLTFVEYCYSFDVERQANYNLYVYIHNPKGREYENSARNAITLRVGSSSGNFKKYPLKELSVCKEKNYEGLFYKYGVEITDIQKVLMLNELNSAARMYEIGEIELVESGRLLATSYDVGSKYEYSGYSKGYGANKDVSTLQMSRMDSETLTLDVKSTYYRPDGTNGKNDYTQDSLHSVYFAVPNDVIKKYGAMTAVHATWLNAVLAPCLVTGNQEAYKAILNYVGKNIGKETDDLEYGYLGAYKVTASSTTGFLQTHSYSGFSYNREHNPDYDEYGDSIETLYMLFNAGSKNNSADNYTVSSDDIRTILEESASKYGGNLVNEKYAACMFESVDEEFTEVNIQANEEYSLTDERISNSWWDLLLKKNGNTITTKFDGIKAIYAVQESDMVGPADVVSDRLYIAESDYNEFKSYYDKYKKDYTVYLFRYQVSDFVSQEATLFKRGSFLGVKTWDEIDSNAYFFQETVNLNFDVIDVTFTGDEESTVLPVLMSPMDIIYDATPPVYTKSDTTIPWWVWLIVGLLALFIIGKLVPPIFKGLVIVLKIVTFPVWGPIWLIVKIIKKIRGDYD